MRRLFFERYKDKVKYWMTFNEINAMFSSPRPWHQAGLIYGEDENAADVKLQAAHHQLIASALTVKARHEINPDFKIGCMLIYPLTYAATCNPYDQVLSRNKMLSTYYFGDVQVRGYYSNTCKAYQESIGGHFEMLPGDEEILKEGVVDYIGFSYYFSQHRRREAARTGTGKYCLGGKNPISESNGLGLADRPNRVKSLFKQSLRSLSDPTLYR